MIRMHIEFISKGSMDAGTMGRQYHSEDKFFNDIGAVKKWLAENMPKRRVKIYQDPAAHIGYLYCLGRNNDYMDNGKRYSWFDYRLITCYEERRVII